MSLGVYGGTKYPRILRGDFSRYVWMFFVSYKSNVADISETSQLAENRSFSFESVVYRSDDEGDSNEQNFGKLLPRKKA